MTEIRRIATGEAVAWDVGYEDAQASLKAGLPRQCPYQSKAMSESWQDGWSAFFIDQRLDAQRDNVVEERESDWDGREWEMEELY